MLDQSPAAPSHFSLDADQIAVRDMARAFADEVFAPNARGLGRSQTFSSCRNAQSRGARHGRHFYFRGCRRLRPVAADCGPDLRSTGDWLPDGRCLHVDPQYDGLDDRRLRHGRAAPAMAAKTVHDGTLGQLLPDRTRLGFGRGGARDAGNPRRRSLRAQRPKAVHLGRRRGRSLCGHGAHRRRRTIRDFGADRAGRHSRNFVRRQRAQDGLECPADARGHF